MSELPRRLFLRTAVLAGAGTLLHGCTAANRSRLHDVVVLGAGMAGLTAGRELAHAGLDMIVLEARDRVGGRMHTLSEPAPHGLEVGAQLVHGTRAATWTLLREFEIETRPFPNVLGQWVWNPSAGFVKPDSERGEKAQARLREAYRNHRGGDVSLQALLAQAGFSQEEQTMLSDLALSWSAEPDEISVAAAIEDSAAWDAYFDENFQVIGGYQSLAQKMTAELGDAVRLSCRVQAVEWRRGEVVVSCEREGRPEKVRARRAVVTLPIGVLQSGAPVFSPGLPDWKRRSIDALHMGRVVVVHLMFDDWFWRQMAPGVSSWSRDAGRISFWDPHPEGKGVPALQGWITGRAAQQISDLGQAAGLQRILSWVEESFPGAGARKRLKWSTLRDWVRDPFALGSYSYTRPGGRGQREVLATPVEECLHFAGEATVAPPHYQTVHGAYLSGRRAAREILSALGRDVRASRAAQPAAAVAV